VSRAGDDDRGGARGTGDDRELLPPRLTDGPAPAAGSAEELVVAFMRAAKPYQTPPGRRQRLHAALAGGRRARRPVRSWLKPALALGLLACAAATVSAHLLEWPRWLAERLPGHEPAAARTAAAARSASVRPGGVAGVPTPAPNEAPVVEPLAVPVSPPTAEVVPAEVPTVADAAPAAQPIPARGAQLPAPRHRTRVSVARASRSNATTAAHDDAAPPALAEAGPAPARVEAKPTPAMPPAGDAAKAKAARRDTSEEDAALALAALTALRRDHDPVRARAMVDAYLRAQPNGAMAEEALAIAIEAAAAHQDADAKSLATRYLSLYPSGMFRALARKTLRSADAESR